MRDGVGHGRQEDQTVAQAKGTATLFEAWGDQREFDNNRLKHATDA